MANPEQHVIAVFYTEAVQHGAESEKQGRPIFKDVPFVRIIIPGDSLNVIERKASEKDKRDYPKAWENYERGEKSGATGMPLEQWPQITRSQVKEAKYFEDHSVEQLSALSDSNAQRMGMGFMELRNKARAYLEVAAGTAHATAQAAENERLKSMLADMQAQIADLQEKRGPGRPRKETAEA